LHLLDVGSGTVSSMPKQPKGLFSSAFFDKLTGDLCVGFVNESTPAMVVTLDATTGAPKKAVLPADGTLPPAGATNSGKKSVKTPPRSFESIHFASENGDEVQGWLALPADESEGPWPTILHTHGGPTSIQLQSYNPAAQAWLDAGFAWCSINYHGSTE
jgi:dipeptidyl aminopeptidase/acylaminoacyl peptidase